MEMLVTLEVVHQVQALPQPLQDFIKISQVKAYALNILPPLYVTSAEGWERQWERGKHELYDKVKLAVRQGIAAVRRDPLRETTALPHDRTPVADSVLKQIQQLLGDDSLTWYNVVPALKRSLRQRPAEPSVAPARASALIPPGSQARSSPAQPPQAKPSPAQAQADPGRSGEFDWDAHPLHQRGW
ncbi:MAG: late competence development ComFB family protein [Synechococcales cyanobacterium RM1_1_8]|nr:late competence development ComFB family protein [Synechococcales cyanobacterium RM1_1_8]